MMKQSIVKSSALGVTLFGNAGGVLFALPVIIFEVLWNFRKVILGMAWGLAVIGLVLLGNWVITECGMAFAVAFALIFGGCFGTCTFLDDFRKKKEKAKRRTRK